MDIRNYLSIGNLVWIAVIGALGLNILVGWTGQISIGHAAFMSVGAARDPERELRFALATVVEGLELNSVEAIVELVRQGFGIGINEYEVLVRLSERPGRAMRMAQLADAMAHSRSRVTHTVARMEDRGLAERRRRLGAIALGAEPLHDVGGLRFGAGVRDAMASANVRGGTCWCVLKRAGGTR